MTLACSNIPCVNPVRMDGNVISGDTRATVLTFTCLYFLLIFIGWFAFMVMGLDFVEGYSISVSCVGNIGPALGTLAVPSIRMY